MVDRLSPALYTADRMRCDMGLYVGIQYTIKVIGNRPWYTDMCTILATRIFFQVCPLWVRQDLTAFEIRYKLGSRDLNILIALDLLPPS